MVKNSTLWTRHQSIMTNQEQGPMTEKKEFTVGQVLQQERARRGITLEQAAQHLHLKLEILQSIEADQPDKNVIPTFMRGYLRSYARYLKIPEQQLLSRFEQAHQVKSAPVKVMKTFSNRQARQQTEKRLMWLTYFIVAVLLASLAVWLWQGAREFSAGNSVSTMDPATPRSTYVDAAAGSAPVSVNPNAVSETTTTATAPELLSQSPSTVMPVTLPATTDTDLENALPAAANGLDTTPPQMVAPVSTAESFGDSHTVGLDRLKMTFTDNCWIDVLDANGERVAYGTKQGGYVMELNAKGPFTVTLGNPGVVSIEINQQPFDLSGFPGGRVAKFTLAGPSE